MSVPRGKEVIIVGGGASGTLLAVQLLRDRSAHVRVTLVEKGQQPGLGLAYSTSNPSHLLNVRAANMSAFADDPDHFVRWLASDRDAGELHCADRFCFAPRKIYGRYIGSLLERSWRAMHIRAGCASSGVNAPPSPKPRPGWKRCLMTARALRAKLQCWQPVTKQAVRLARPALPRTHGMRRRMRKFPTTGGCSSSALV